MKKLTNCIITETGLTTIIDGKSYSVSNSHKNYIELFNTFKTKDASEFLRLYSTSLKLSKSKDFKTQESLIIGFDSVTWRGIPVRNVIVDRIIECNNNGVDIKPLSNFLEKTLNLTQENAEALFLFIESKSLPILEDGDVLGWKIVTKDFKDKHTNSIDNSPGAKIPEIPRALCDTTSVACSKGYHIGNLEYSGPKGSFKSNGDKVILVKFNPTNLVSTPSDVHENKIRVTTYEVLCEYDGRDIPDYIYKSSKLTEFSFSSLKRGDIIQFKYNGTKSLNINLKYMGVSRKINDGIWGRVLKGSTWLIPGASATFSCDLIKEPKIKNDN